MFCADMILGKRRIKVRVKSMVLRRGPRRRRGQHKEEERRRS